MCGPSLPDLHDTGQALSPLQRSRACQQQFRDSRGGCAELASGPLPLLLSLFGPIFLLKNETMVFFGVTGVAISQDDN